MANRPLILTKMNTCEADGKDKGQIARNARWRLLISTLCVVGVFSINLSHYAMTPDPVWHELKQGGRIVGAVFLSTVAVLCLLPLLVRGPVKQRLVAGALVVVAGYCAYQSWGILIENYVING